jgi:hypothetical protein
VRGWIYARLGITSVGIKRVKATYVIEIGLLVLKTREGYSMYGSVVSKE